MHETVAAAASMVPVPGGIAMPGACACGVRDLTDCHLRAPTHRNAGGGTGASLTTPGTAISRANSRILRLTLGPAVQRGLRGWSLRDWSLLVQHARHQFRRRLTLRACPTERALQQNHSPRAELERLQGLQPHAICVLCVACLKWTTPPGEAPEPATHRDQTLQRRMTRRKPVKGQHLKQHSTKAPNINA